MAMRGRPLDAQTIRKIQRVRETANVSQTARQIGVSRPTVYKYHKKSSQ